MKCPVCGQENQSMLCPKCGFDSSLDYGKYPTFGIVGKAPAVSTLKTEWEEKQRPVEPKTPPEVFFDPDFQLAFDDPSWWAAEPEIVEKPQKRIPWQAIIACVIPLVVGIWLGWETGSWMLPSNGPEENVQVQAPPDTTVQTTPPETITPQSEGALSESSSWRANVLKQDIFSSSYVYGTAILKSSVKTVTFLDTLEDVPGLAFDVSQNGNGSVKMWFEKDSVPYDPNLVADGWELDLYFAADGGINAKSACSGLFCGYSKLKKIDFGKGFHTREVWDMSLMFANCHKLSELDLSSFDTGNVLDMGAMFQDCRSLCELDLRSFNTANVQDMSFMFGGCENLTNLVLSSFDTGNVQNMDSMFDNCPAGDDWQHLLHEPRPPAP